MDSARVTDPVCGMTISKHTAEAQSEYHGQTYYFCYTACKTLFDWDPEKHLAKMDRKETQPS
jgi:Cu+-exporting ATPase